MTNTIIRVCKSCLETNSVNSDGLCERCAEWDASIDGTLQALLDQEIEAQ